MDVILNEDIMSWAVCGLFAVIVAGIEWARWFFVMGTYPVIFTMVAVIVLGWTILRFRTRWSEIDRLKTGLLGERSVGQYLQNALLRKGYWIVHDVCEDDYNIDHVLIGPGGVFAIETKTRRKPGGDARIDYDGKQVRIAGQIPDRDPVAQAQACASRLQRILLEKTGIKIAVRSVVLFPGWYVNEQPRGVETWVMNEKNLVGFLNHESEKLQTSEIFTLAAALGHYVRDRDTRDT